MSFNQNQCIVGMNYGEVAVPSAGTYFVDGKIQLPRIAAGGGQSAVVATITNQTGPVTLYTGTAGADGFYCTAICAAADVIRVTLSSADDDDTPLNAVKCEFSVGSGQ